MSQHLFMMKPFFWVCLRTAMASLWDQHSRILKCIYNVCDHTEIIVAVFYSTCNSLCILTNITVLIYSDPLTEESIHMPTWWVKYAYFVYSLFWILVLV